MASSSWRTLRSLVMLATLGAVTLSACFWSDVRKIGESLRAMVADQVPGLAEQMPWLEPEVEAELATADTGMPSGADVTFEPFRDASGDVSAIVPTARPSTAEEVDHSSPRGIPSPIDAWPSQDDETIAQPSIPIRPATPAHATQVAAQENVARGSETERLRRAEARLQDLGAQHYLLEGWGPTGELYRFECQMALPGEQGIHRHFEATKEQPLAAVEAVLADVEAWHQGWRR